MPAAIDEQIRRKVIQQWVNGFPRDKIAAENNIGAGTVTSIVSNYKIGLEESDVNSARQISIEIRKQGLNWSDLASHFRLLNFIRKLGASEEKLESFIYNINSCNLPPKKLLRL